MSNRKKLNDLNKRKLNLNLLVEPLTMFICNLLIEEISNFTGYEPSQRKQGQLQCH